MSLRKSVPDLARLAQTREEVSQDPAQAQGSFSVVTEWNQGTRAIARVRKFEVGTDEPLTLGGTDAAPDPMELLLAALGSCLAIGWVKQAQMRGVHLRKLQVVVDAPYDLRGYLDLSSDVRPGFSQLSYRVEVDSDAPEEVLVEIKAAAERTSPLLDNILNATPLSGRIIRQA